MSSLSAVATRVVAEVNDATNNTLSASITGTLLSEVQQYVVDGIQDYRHYVYREIFDQSLVTSANRRSYVVSALSPVPFIIKRLEYVQSPSAVTNLTEVDLWNGTMYLYYNDTPLYTQANNYFNIYYYAQHDVPSAGSASLTVPSQDDGLLVDFAKTKVMQKQALDQRGINQDSSNEFLNMASNFERRYKDGLRRAMTPFTSYLG